jgi:DNA-binding XRE family transcriptional regulator
VIHRHIVYPAGTPPERLPSAALADILDRGDLDAWRPIAAAIARDPLGPLAEKVMVLLDSFPMYGTSPLWRAWIDRCRARADSGAQAAPLLGLAALRRRFGLTQTDVAKRVGMSQSDLSKLERRTDVRLSTLQAYAEALGGRIAAVFTAGTGRIEVLPGSARVDRRAPRRRGAAR